MISSILWFWTKEGQCSQLLKRYKIEIRLIEKQGGNKWKILVIQIKDDGSLGQSDSVSITISSPDIFEGRADRIADELGVTLRDRKSRMNSSVLASIDEKLLKLDKGTQLSDFIGKWVHLNYYISCWVVFQEVNQ